MRSYIYCCLALIAACADPYQINRGFDGEQPLWVEEYWECEGVTVGDRARVYTCLSDTGPPSWLGPDAMCEVLTSDTTGTRPQ